VGRIGREHYSTEQAGGNARRRRGLCWTRGSDRSTPGGFEVTTIRFCRNVTYRPGAGDYCGRAAHPAREAAGADLPGGRRPSVLFTRGIRLRVGCCASRSKASQPANPSWICLNLSRAMAAAMRIDAVADLSHAPWRSGAAGQTARSSCQWCQGASGALPARHITGGRPSGLSAA
jgi:hypothetical protein